MAGGEYRAAAGHVARFLPHHRLGPPGTPHWYKEVEGSVTYLEVRFDVELKK